MFNRLITDDIQEIMTSYITSGDLVVDLTMGNGHDTLFLANLVGPSGRVVAFDIQELALLATKDLLEEKQISWVELHRVGHEHIKTYVDGDISAAMMNLGYLPGADKQVVTKQSTTIKAISDTLLLLKSKGLLAIAAYVGHAGSFEEVNALEAYLKGLKTKHYAVRQISYVNRENNPPIIYLIQKK